MSVFWPGQNQVLTQRAAFVTNHAEMRVRAVWRLSDSGKPAESRWPHRLCPAFGRQQRRLAIPGRSKLLRWRGFCDAGLCGQCLDVRHRHADALIQAVQPIVPVPQHAGANRVETGGVFHVLDDLSNGGCHRRADPFNEFTLAGWVDSQKNLQKSPDRLHVVPALAPVDVHARWVVGVAVVGQEVTSTNSE